MAAYDFTGLSPSDFESLSGDLLSVRLGVPLQGFVTGRDKGIDLRHAPIDGQDWIVQCKHFARSGFSKLRSHLAKKELPKIKQLQSGRYILATSVGLSPANVDELFALLSPYCRSKHDMFGQDDLNAVLRANADIERRHFKLWFTSEAVLSRVLHNDVFVQSMLTEDELKRKLGLYVRTDCFDKARKKLDSERVCILSGVPGVGKTTLAEMLLVEYLMKDWQVISIHQNVAEGLRLFSQNRASKQVFYYDDFLGQISTGEKLGKNEDRALLQLIEAVSRTANKRFILTTREYILAQARAEHEHLARANINLYRFVVSCDDYSDIDKARILANHLYFANVPQEHIAELVENRTYRHIISHRNYNPRIIEWMTKASEIKAIRPKKYPAAFMEGLENPAELWTHAFENQISEAARHLLLVLGSCGDGLMLADLQQAFEAFYFGRAKQYGFPASPSCFKKALEELEGNFIRIERNGTEIVASCHNPSVLDFLNEWFGYHATDVADLLRYALFFEQVERLFNVFNVATPKGSKWKTAIDPDLVGAAIDRSLLARSVQLSSTGNPLKRWTRTYSSHWDRLQVCCRIGTHISGPNLRKCIQEHLDAQLSEAVAEAGESVGLMALLEVADGCRWLERSLVDRWHERVWNRWLAMEEDSEEPLDGLSLTARWFMSKRDGFGPEQALIVQHRLRKAVRHEVTVNSDRNDAQRLGGDLAIVEEIASTLHLDFSPEIDRLNEALSECGSSDGDDSNEDLRSYDDACTSSIESIFDALLE
jgi:hypothetical protein